MISLDSARFDSALFMMWGYGEATDWEPYVTLLDGRDLAGGVDARHIHLANVLIEARRFGAESCPTSLAQAHDIVSAAANRFATNSKAHDVSPAIVAVRTYIAGLVDEEISRLKNLGKLDTAGQKALLHLGGILKHRLTSQGQSLAASGDVQRFVAGVESVLGITVQHERVGPQYSNFHVGREESGRYS